LDLHLVFCVAACCFLGSALTTFLLVAWCIQVVSTYSGKLLCYSTEVTGNVRRLCYPLLRFCLCPLSHPESAWRLLRSQRYADPAARLLLAQPIPCPPELTCVAPCACVCAQIAYVGQRKGGAKSALEVKGEPESKAAMLEAKVGLWVCLPGAVG
jgi:hypothetical protein